jgi:hypothetical protein
MDRPNPPAAAAILEGPEGLRAGDGLVRIARRAPDPQALMKPCRKAER